MHVFRGYLFFVLFVSVYWISTQVSFAKPREQGISPWMYYLLAPQHFRLQKQTTGKTLSLIEALTDSYMLTKQPINSCNYFRLTFNTTNASVHTSEHHKYTAILQWYGAMVIGGPQLIVEYVRQRQRGYHIYAQYYVTTGPLPLFRPTQVIKGLCGSIDVLIFHRAKIAGYYKVFISVPKPLSINISVLHYSSHYEAWGCTYDRVTIGYFRKNSTNFLTCFHFCGRSHKRNVFVPVSTAEVHLHYLRFSQDSQLHLQFQGSHPPDQQNRGKPLTIFTGYDVKRIAFAPACGDFKLQDVANASSIQTGQLSPFQYVKAYYVAYYVTITSSVINSLTELHFYKVNISFPVQNCTGQEHGQITVYDGPYAGVLSPHVLTSPYSVLMQGECRYIVNRTASSSVGDISVVWLNRLRKDYQFTVGFSTKLTNCGHDFCFTRTLQPGSHRTSSITVLNKETPSVQALTFHVTNPNHNIHLNFRVHESTVLDVGEYCEYGIIKIVEIRFVRAFYCSKDALRMLNQSGNSDGFQFNNRNITIVLKTYPQSVKLNMTISYRATYTYGLFNINPVAERHQWFSSDALRPGMHCFHGMKLTESPFDGNVLHVIPSNDFSCEIKVTEVYSDYNHKYPLPKQLSTIIQYPPYQQGSVEIKSMHVHFAHSGPQPMPDCRFEPWFDYAGNIINFDTSFNVSYAFSTSRADLTFYRGCLYAQPSFFVAIKSAAAICYEVQVAQCTALYFEANGFCGKVSMLKSFGDIFFNSIQIVTQANKSRCCVGFVQMKAEVDSIDHYHQPTATFRICPNGGEFCNSVVKYKLGVGIIHAIDMTQTNGDCIYEVKFDNTLTYQIEFKYKISLVPNTQQETEITHRNGVTAVAFKHCYGQSCYTFWPDRRPLSWSEANESCSGANMSLLSINTDSEWQYVLQTFWEEEFLFTFIHLGFKEALVSSRGLA